VSAFAQYIACFLLVLFARVMIPDALLLELHAHQHTQHDVVNDGHLPQIDQEHNHCPVENLFHAPFHFAATAPELIYPVFADGYTDELHTVWESSSPTTVTLRGPPAA
jgi:hypothetical protein